MLIQTPVPDDDGPGAVIAFGDNPFKILIVEGVIFHLYGQPFLGRVQGRPFGHRPALQHALQFQPEIVVQGPGRVFMHHKNQVVFMGAQNRRRLGSFLELAFFSVFF